MIFDIHTHAYLPGGDVKQTESMLLYAMDKYAIDRIYVSNIPGMYPNAGEIDWANREAARFIRENPGRVEGYVYISPELPNAMEVLKRGIEEQGFAGVKFWISAFCDDPCVDLLAEQMTDYGVPLLIHCWHKVNGQFPFEATGDRVANLARRHPKLKIIMAHFGGNCYHGIPAIRRCKNVWVDISGSTFRGDELNYTVEKLGAQRVLFGSDMTGTYLPNLGQVLEADLTESQRDEICYQNALQIFDRNFRL